MINHIFLRVSCLPDFEQDLEEKSDKVLKIYICTVSESKFWLHRSTAAYLKACGGVCPGWVALAMQGGAWVYAPTPSLGLRSWGLSDREEDEEEAVSVNFPEWR